LRERRVALLCDPFLLSRTKKTRRAVRCWYVEDGLLSVAEGYEGTGQGRLSLLLLLFTGVRTRREGLGTPCIFNPLNALTAA